MAHYQHTDWFERANTIQSMGMSKVRMDNINGIIGFHVKQLS